MRDQIKATLLEIDRSEDSVRSADVRAMPGRESVDAELMARIANSADRSALAALGEHYAPRLKSWLMYRGEQSSTAEDIVQDVLILVWTKSDRFDSARGSFSAWLFRMTRNSWIDHKRKHDRQQPTEPDIVSTLADKPVMAADHEVDQSRAAQAVHEELAKLPVEQKQILQLAFFEGLSHSQIAERTGLALGTVKSRIRVPLRKLKSKLKKFSGVDQ